jgi:putative transposase
MPRQPRINIPYELYHVMARGIERKKIYKTATDRKLFIRRLGELVKACNIVCYAWVMLDNHFHMLVMPTTTSLSSFMHRLLCGYAVNFNIRHKRSGHLFQNRYKSILCQQESYLLELIRYIHLNPLRAGIVKDLEALNNYRWSGHAVLMQKIKRKWQETTKVYQLFSIRKKSAIKKYLQFVSEGRDMAKDDRFHGGGLKRSAGGWSVVKAMLKNKEHWQSDERILGDGDYVERVLKQINKKPENNPMNNWSLSQLLKHIAKTVKVEPTELLKQKRNNQQAEARAVFGYIAKEKMKKKTYEIGQYLQISESAASKLIDRGSRLFNKWRSSLEY